MRVANRTSFKKGQTAWNKRFATKHERYLFHKKDIIQRTKARYIQAVFGISLEGYETKRAAQGPLCAACGEPMIEQKLKKGTSGRSPVLDHDHETGKIREFIHRSCNTALGEMQNDANKLRRLAEYIEKHSCPRPA